MNTRIGTISVGVEVDKSKLESGLKDIKRKTSEFGDSFKSVWGNIAALFSAGVLIKGINDSIIAYGEQEKAVTSLNFALKSQNIYTDELSKAFLEQATALMQLTNVGDEVITSGQAMMMNMGVQADTVRKLTPLILDFSSAMGVDLESAFKLVGKAALGEVETLKRYGIIIDENELATKGFNAVVEKMQKQFEGSAETLAKTEMGGLKGLQVSLGELQEEMGKTLIPTLGNVAAAVVDVIKQFNIMFGIEKDKRSAQQQMLGIYEEEKKKLLSLLKIEENLGMAGGKKYEELRRQLQSYAHLKKQLEDRMVSDTEKAEDKTTKIKVDNSKEWQKKIEQETKKRAKEREQELKEIDENIKEQAKIIKRPYDLMLDLREMNLQDVVNKLAEEMSIKKVYDTEYRAMELAYIEYKKALDLQNAQRFIDFSNNMNATFQSNLADMMAGEKTFADTIKSIYNDIQKAFLKLMLEELIQFKAAALAKTVWNKATAISGAIAAYMGIPFIGPFLAAGAIATILAMFSQYVMKSFATGIQNVNEKTIALLHPGEAVIPANQNPFMGKGLSPLGAGAGGGGTINLTINASVRSDEDWDRVVRGKIIPALNRYKKKTYASPFA